MINMKTLILFLLLSGTAFGQTELIPKYFSVIPYPGTGSTPRLNLLSDSFANFVNYDGENNGIVVDSVPVGTGPFDSLIIDCRTEYPVNVEILYSTWNRGNDYAILDTTGPMTWERSIPLSTNFHRSWPDERNPAFITIQIPAARLDGSQNSTERVYWGNVWLVKNVAGVSERVRATPLHYKFYDEIGRQVDSTNPMARFAR